MSEKKRIRYRPSMVVNALGVLLACFGVLCALSPSTKLQFFAYPLEFLFGIIGFYAVSALFLFFGVKTILRDRLKLKARYVWGAILLLFGTLLLAEDLGAKGLEKASDPAAYANALNAAFQGEGFAMVSNPFLLGGFFAYELDGCLVLVGRWLAILVASLLLLGGLVLVLYSPILSLIHLISADRALSSSKKQRRKQAKEEAESAPSSFSVGEQSDGPTPIEAPASDSDRESLFAEEKKNMEGWKFSLSSDIPIDVKRPSNAQQAAQAPMRQEEPSPEPAYSDPYPNSAYPQNDDQASSYPQNYPQNDYQASAEGMEEAVFIDPAFAPKSQPAQPAPKPRRQAAPKPAPKPAPEPSFAPEEPSPIEDVIPEAEEQAAPEPEQESIPEPTPAPATRPFVAPAPQEATPVQQETPVVEEAEKEKNPEDQPYRELRPYTMPGLDLLTPPKDDKAAKAQAEQDALTNTEIINSTLAEFKIGARVVSHTIGPSVTRYDVEVDHGVQASSIARYVDDISRRLNGTRTRFIQIVPNRTTSAFEVANKTRQEVSFYEVYNALPKGEKYSMFVPFGKSIDGEVLSGDLSGFPHMLVAGTTGSGKSIFIHNMLLSLLMRNRPEDLKLVLVDPKMVEFNAYDDLPNLVCPVIDSASHAKVAFDRLADLMDKRFELFRDAHVRDLKTYNTVYAPMMRKKKIPYIVVVVDEFADLAMQCKDVAIPIQRIGQKGRAAGIHMIIATQRPDAQTISGTIKANLPVTVCLMVKTAVDSQVVLKQVGAEALMDHGDMLIDYSRISKELIRAQGARVDELGELVKVPQYIRAQGLGLQYYPEFLNLEEDQQTADAAEIDEPKQSYAEFRAQEGADKYEQVKAMVMTSDTCSISWIQRNCGCGYPRAEKFFKKLIEDGIVEKPTGAQNSAKGVRVLVHSVEKKNDGATPGSTESATKSYQSEGD